MHNRWRNSIKASNLGVKHDPAETEIQNTFTRNIHSHIEEEQEKYYSAHPDTDKHLHNGHIHKCAYEIVSNDKVWCAAQCRKECKKLTLPPIDMIDYCDICPKMTYIAFDNDSNIIFAERTFTEDIIKCLLERNQENLSNNQ